MISNLAEFKKAMKVGIKVHTLSHQCLLHDKTTGAISYCDMEIGTRTVSKSHTKAFALDTPTVEDKSLNVWSYYKKAKNYKFEGNSVTECNDEGTKLVTYTILP